MTLSPITKRKFNPNPSRIQYAYAISMRSYFYLPNGFTELRQMESSLKAKLRMFKINGIKKGIAKDIIAIDVKRVQIGLEKL